MTDTTTPKALNPTCLWNFDQSECQTPPVTGTDHCERHGDTDFKALALRTYYGTERNALKSALEALDRTFDKTIAAIDTTRAIAGRLGYEATRNDMHDVYEHVAEAQGRLLGLLADIAETERTTK